ncbi:hypothetical protein ABK040_009543 [Willaertia magna]
MSTPTSLHLSMLDSTTIKRKRSDNFSEQTLKKQKENVDPNKQKARESKLPKPKPTSNNLLNSSVLSTLSTFSASSTRSSTTSTTKTRVPLAARVGTTNTTTRTTKTTTKTTTTRPKPSTTNNRLNSTTIGSSKTSTTTTRPKPKPTTSKTNITTVSSANTSILGSSKTPAKWDIKGQLESSKIKLKSLSEENVTLRSTVEQQSIELEEKSIFEEQAKKLSVDVRKYQEENNELKSKTRSQEIELSAVKSIQEKFQSENIDLRVKVSSLQQEFEREKKQSEMEKMTMKVQHESEMRIQRDDYEHQIREIKEIKEKELQLTKERMGMEISKVKNDLERCQMDLNYANEDGKNKAEKIKELENIIAQQIETIKELENKRHKDENERRRLHNIIQELKGNIRVYCRVKPSPEGEKSIIYPEDDVDERSLYIQAAGESKKFFQFDKVFKPNSSQQQIFHEISQLVQSALDGYKVCIFAYGQTGSGKTYTMFGPSKEEMQQLENVMKEEAAGMIPRSIDQVFETAEKLKEQGWKFTMVASFLEIYNEGIRDLLDASNKDGSKYEIKHDNGLTTVTGLTYVPVDGPRKVQELLRSASKSRAVAATKCNERSSRSHSVFSLQITGKNENTDQVSTGVLNLIDLAGSERLNVSQATGDRLKETKHINTSLTCLGDVIAALSQKSKHIPYRNSKLTYLLQNCLGGDAKTLMFVNIDPINTNETVCSLRFAAKVNSCEIHATRKIK